MLSYILHVSVYNCTSLRIYRISCTFSCDWLIVRRYRRNYALEVFISTWLLLHANHTFFLVQKHQFSMVIFAINSETPISIDQPLYHYRMCLSLRGTLNWTALIYLRAQAVKAETNLRWADAEYKLEFHYLFCSFLCHLTIIWFWFHKIESQMMTIDDSYYFQTLPSSSFGFIE